MLNFILVNTSLSENIGMAIRAMVTMGYTNLTLVKPKSFDEDKVKTLAANAFSHINITFKQSLTEAVCDFDTVIGTSARSVRSLNLTPVNLTKFNQNNVKGKCAIVFGNERTGLTNAELNLCHHLIHINTNASYPVLNLAQAVQIIAYEFNKHNLTADFSQNELQIASNEIFYLINQLHLNDSAKEKLQRFFKNLKLTANENNLLTGVLSGKYLPKS